MAETDTLVRAALAASKAGWTRYFQALWMLNLAIGIDLLTGAQFFADQATINALGFAIPRTAFSFTFAAIFLSFVIWAVSSTRLLRQLLDEPGGSDLKAVPAAVPEVRLWILSPLNPAPRMRLVFWLLAADAPLLLLIISLVHVSGYKAPDPEQMAQGLYRGIGWVGLSVLVVTAMVVFRHLVPDFEQIRLSIGHEGRRPARSSAD
jgi:hypothetical protein